MKNLKSNQEKSHEQFIEEIVAEVERDFEKRRRERLPYERQWELNMNFLHGNQYCFVGENGEILSDDKEFFWQNRMVFNHIAPIMETRAAKFSRVTPKVAVRPISDDDKDVASASIAEKLIAEAFKRNDAYEVVKQATAWSESCGTAFYKIVWDNFGGDKIGTADGADVYEGEVKIIPVSPFEIFPDSLYVEHLTDCKSLIHARAMYVDEIFKKYNVKVVGEKISPTGLIPAGDDKKNEEETFLDKAVVIEKFELPSKEFPDGRLITVSGGKLLYYGTLPYVNDKYGKRGFPFVKQVSCFQTGSFFGTSVIERLIPVQRAYNAVKNRKHEFMNRLSTGILTVEDGSVDVDDLSSDGLSPGKVLVYRQGAKAPEIMNETSLPPDFDQEESKLLAEFVTISGVSDVSSSSENARLSSGSALSILIDQDNERMTVIAERIRSCFIAIATQILRLYAQFTSGLRAVRYQDGANKTRVDYADAQVAKNDDLYLESENELLYTPSQKKEMIFKLYDSGLLFGEGGKLHPSTKERVLSLLGYNDLDYQKGIAGLHEEKAQAENETIRKKGLSIESVDEHSIHINEHTRYFLSEYKELGEKEKNYFFEHIDKHKRALNELEKQ